METAPVHSSWRYLPLRLPYPETWASRTWASPRSLAQCVLATVICDLTCKWRLFCVYTIGLRGGALRPREARAESCSSSLPGRCQGDRKDSRHHGTPCPLKGSVGPSCSQCEKRPSQAPQNAASRQKGLE